MLFSEMEELDKEYFWEWLTETNTDLHIYSYDINYYTKDTFTICQ